MNGLGAFCRHAHGRKQEIDLAGQKCGNAVGHGERHEFHLDAEIVGKGLADIGIKTVLHAAGIDEAPRRIIALNADDDLALGLGLFHRTGESIDRYDEGQGNRCRGEREQGATREFHAGGFHLWLLLTKLMSSSRLSGLRSAAAFQRWRPTGKAASRSGNR
ncbi:hypothetical protein D3C78_1111230 [compost metagenome]